MKKTLFAIVSYIEVIIAIIYFPIPNSVNVKSVHSHTFCDPEFENHCSNRMGRN